LAELRIREVPAGFRVCPVTGLLCHIPTQNLILANAVMAVLSLLVGGIAALFVALSRAPLFLVKDHATYYMWLTAHGMNMLIFWILWFEVALLYFVSTVLLNSPLFSVRLGWVAFALMLLGWLSVNYSIFSGKASVLFTVYPPMTAHTILFYLGYILFALGVLIAIALFFATIYKARVERRFEGSLPLVTFGAGIAAIIGFTVVAHGAIALVYNILYHSGYIETVNVMFYRWFFWGLGHNAQYVNVTAMVAVWYALLALATGLAVARFVNEKYAKIAFGLYAIFVVPGIGHHILVDPGFSLAFKQASGSVGSHFLSIPSMLHALALLGGLEALLRASGHTGLFGWLTRIPWGNPGIAGLLLSMLLFGLGGIIAQPQTTLQPNLNYHNTMWVPSHFHFTVVGGTTLAFMTLSYYVIPLLTLRKLYSVSLARLQIYISFIGILVMALAMAWLGWLGAPRRSLIPEDLMRPEWFTPAWILGLGAVLWLVGGALYIVVAVLTLVAGKRTEAREELVEGLVTTFHIVDEKLASKRGALIIVFALLFIILLSLYFISFIRISLMPVEVW